MKTFYRLTIWADNKEAFVSQTDIPKEFQRKILKGERIDEGVLIPTLTIKNKTKKNPDFMGDSIASIVVSDKFKKILEDSSDKNFLQFFKCHFLNIKLQDNFWLVNILENIEAVDREKSSFTTFPDNPEKIDEIKKLTLKESAIKDRNIFRIKEDHYHIFISDGLKNTLTENGITGTRFIKSMNLTTDREDE